MNNLSTRIPSGMGSVGGIGPVHNLATMPLHAVRRRLSGGLNYPTRQSFCLGERSMVSKNLYESRLDAVLVCLVGLNNSESNISSCTRIVCRVYLGRSVKTPARTVRDVITASLIINNSESGGINGRRDVKLASFGMGRPFCASLSSKPFTAPPSPCDITRRRGILKPRVCKEAQ